MHVIPVLDLRAGAAVHARGGDRSRYAPVRSRLAPHAPGDARVLARAFRDELGLCDGPYVADLDAIEGGAPQRELLRALAGDGARPWVDRAVATAAAAREALADGALRVIVGLETLPSLELLAPIASAAGGDRHAIAFSLDLRDGSPVSPNERVARMPPLVVAEAAAAAGVRTIIALDLARVGTGAGVDTALVANLVRALPGVAIVAGGGIRGGEDLARLADAGAWGALVGSALHDVPGYRGQDAGVRGGGDGP